jgi:hypothetical protein
MSDFWKRVEEQDGRETKANALRLDAAGRPLNIGDTVAYGVLLSRSAAVQIGTLIGWSPKGKPQIKIDERFRKTRGSKEVVTLQFYDRMVKLETIDNAS